MPYNVETANDVGLLILVALAEVRQSDYNTLVREAIPGDIDMTAKEEVAVVAILEDKLGCGPLLEPKDIGKDKKQANSCLCPVNGSSVTNLTTIIQSKIAIKE